MRPHFRALSRRVRALERVSRGCTFYERHEILDQQGQVLSTYQRGLPLVYRKGLGMVPIDPDRPLLDDGTVVQQTTLGYTDNEGRWNRVIRYRRLPGPDRSLLVERRAVAPTQTQDQKTTTLSRLLQGQGKRVSVHIVVREREPCQPLPPRCSTGLAFAEHQRVDHLSPKRDRLQKENSIRRTRGAASILRWIRAIGGRVRYHATLHGNIVVADVPRAHLKTLLERPDIVRVEPCPDDGQAESDVTTEYLCGNYPVRWDPTKDASICEPNYGPRRASFNITPFLDAVNAATGVLAYVDAGYDGEIGGGLGNWGRNPHFTREAWPTLTYGIRDGFYVDAGHPAFDWSGRSRFLYVFHEPGARKKHFDEVDTSKIEVLTGSQVLDVMPEYDEGEGVDEGHATRCAAVAISNAYLGGDPDLTTPESQGARSGVARKVTALSAATTVNTVVMLDMVGKTWVSEFNTLVTGIDVISSSYKEGHGEYLYALKARCASDADARGLDTGSLAVVYAFTNDQVVFTKAGGNDHRLLSDCEVPVEVSAPGASAAAISSAALHNDSMTAAQMQRSDELRVDSSRAFTLDGRSYPLLAVANTQCGCAAIEPSDYEGGMKHGYSWQGKTSGTAPRMAGAALIFKHWYLEQYGSLGNQAGRIVVNMLNFADGYTSGLLGSSDRRDPPFPGWGLGRFRMHLFPDPQQESDVCWGTTSVLVWSESVTTIDITGGRGSLPAGIRHLRITAWWVEMNTGEDEVKAVIALGLAYTDKAGSPAYDVEANGYEHVIRMQYDHTDDHFPCPPGAGTVTLSVFGLGVPWEERSPYSEEGPILPLRTVYLSWYWETGPDPSLISCSSLPVDAVGCDRPGASAGGLLPLVAHLGGAPRVLLTVEAATRDALRVATGTAPDAGTSPVFEHGLR